MTTNVLVSLLAEQFSWWFRWSKNNFWNICSLWNAQTIKITLPILKKWIFTNDDTPYPPDCLCWLCRQSPVSTTIQSWMSIYLAVQTNTTIKNSYLAGAGFKYKSGRKEIHSNTVQCKLRTSPVLFQYIKSWQHKYGCLSCGDDSSCLGSKGLCLLHLQLGGNSVQIPAALAGQSASTIGILLGELQSLEG